jgi:partner of Y14 and mago protein
LEDGNSVIPASVRPDGSVRKEIRVKAGYRPPEDVEVYKNRTAHAWKNRAAGVPGAEDANNEPSAGKTAAATASAAKNAKRREARKRAATTSTENMPDALAGQETGEETKTNDPSVASSSEAQPKGDPESERLKEARKLAKKLRQARDLQSKKDEGNNLLPEQIHKVIKINELLRQLDQLGFDENGDAKPSG